MEESTKSPQELAATSIVQGVFLDSRFSQVVGPTSELLAMMAELTRQFTIELLLQRTYGESAGKSEIVGAVLEIMDQHQDHLPEAEFNALTDEIRRLNP